MGQKEKEREKGRKARQGKGLGRFGGCVDNFSDLHTLSGANRAKRNPSCGLGF